MSCCDDCSKKAYRVTRYKSSSLAISRSPVYFGHISKTGKQTSVDFKARAYRQGGRNRLEYKAGLTGSQSRYLQTVQGVVSAILPGDLSQLRSPVRSRLWSAAIPSGIPGMGGPGGSKPGENRGYRCPEGYQYGGRFTDSRFSTCGQKLFDIPSIIGTAVGIVIGAIGQAATGVRISGRTPRFSDQLGEVINTRAPQIPRVGKANAKNARQSAESVLSEIVEFSGTFRRVVRRDGFVLEPVVSAAVLRTVPDNRDMEGATYIASIDKPSLIGTNDDIGLLSNTGISKIVYVLPDGSKISLEKSRLLTVGERRKLGRTIKTLDSVDTSQDPAAKLKSIATQMGGGLAYSEDFKSTSPNDIIETALPGSTKTRKIKRWYYDAFVKPQKKRKKNPQKINEIVSDNKQINKKISSLAAAVRHLNSNGKISDISPSIRGEAIKRSKIFKTKKLKNGLTQYEKVDGQTLTELMSEKTYEHIGAMVASDIQRYLELLAPQVIVSGAAGKRRPYLVQESNDVIAKSSYDTNLSPDLYNYEDLLKIVMSDFVTDVRSRDVSSIAAIATESARRTTVSSNRSAGLAGLAGNSASIRNDVDIRNFYSAEYLAMIRSNFEKRSLAQKQIAVRLFDAMISRLREYDLSDMTMRLSLDGELSKAEQNHLTIVANMIENRIKRLSSSKSIFLKITGLSK